LKTSNLSESEKQKKRSEYTTNESNYLRLRRCRMSIQEFTLLALLGKGGYGEVYLARKTDTGEIVALKRMKKSRFTNINQVHYFTIEKRLLKYPHLSYLIIV
jgi:serine/threonine protein kinase